MMGYWAAGTGENHNGYSTYVPLWLSPGLLPFSPIKILRSRHYQTIDLVLREYLSCV